MNINVAFEYNSSSLDGLFKITHSILDQTINQRHTNINKRKQSCDLSEIMGVMK